MNSAALSCSAWGMSPGWLGRNVVLEELEMDPHQASKEEPVSDHFGT